MKSRTCALVLVIVLSAAVLSAQTLTLTPADIAYSIFMQFSGATDASGTPIYRTGTTSGLAVNLEECSGCGVSGWGWRDERWGPTLNTAPVLLRFPQGGWQSIVIQTREDGVSVDQIVLSAEQYRTSAPGAAKNDTTIVGRR